MKHINECNMRVFVTYHSVCHVNFSVCNKNHNEFMRERRGGDILNFESHYDIMTCIEYIYSKNDNTFSEFNFLFLSKV